MRDSHSFRLYSSRENKGRNTATEPEGSYRATYRMCQPDEVFRSTMILLVSQEEFLQMKPEDAFILMVFKTRKSVGVNPLFRWGGTVQRYAPYTAPLIQRGRLAQWLVRGPVNRTTLLFVASNVQRCAQQQLQCRLCRCSMAANLYK